jgi:hypothetical protein
MSDAVISFCVGTGRCGTTLLAQLAALEPDVAASHERLRLPATFHMYCKWHGIPVDPEGFLIDREAAIRDDLRDHRVSFESSALLSHSIAELHARFDARFLLLVRSPGHTIASFAARGWFLDAIPWRDPALPPTLREGVEPRHFFGRNLPRGAEYARWSALSQVGKIAWFYNARIRGILDQLRALPAAHRRIARLEDLDFGHYADVATFLGWRPTIVREQFAALADSRPNAGPNAPIVLDERAAADIEAEVAPLAAALGYEHRAAHIVAGAGVARALPPVEAVLSAARC